MTWMGQFCWILICLHAFFFGYINQPAYDHIQITWEDGAVENLTFVAFLLAGIALSVAALATRRLSLRCVYILGGITLLFFAGEEINWGQRIIGFETPDFLTDLNEEFNIHNIKSNQWTWVLYFLTKKEAIFGLCLAACAAFFVQKNRVLGIPFLPITLTLAILITLSHFYRNFGSIINFESLALSDHRGLFLLLLMVALLSMSARTFIAVAASFSVSLYADYAFHHSWSYHIYYRGTHDEQSEYLFSVCCLFYAMMALLDQRTARQKIAASVAALKSATALPSIRIKSPPPPSQNITSLQESKRRLTPWTAICALIIAGSVGLALMTHLHYRADVAAFQETLLLTRTAGPAARSNFDVYIDGRDLRYFKQPCDRRPDLRAIFFLSVFPQNVYDLPVERRQHGFENLDFRFGQHGGMLDGACAARVELPSYEIASISTGQYTWDAGGVVTNLWLAEFPYDSAGDYEAYAAAFEETRSLTQTAEPAARSNFDVYIDGRELHYFKQPCVYTDSDATFFLGVFPQNVDDLPVGQRQNGFENLDFDFGQYGQMIDDACAAKVRLPDYEIAKVSTGQYTWDADGAPTNIWIAEFPVNK